MRDLPYSPAPIKRARALAQELHALAEQTRKEAHACAVVSGFRQNAKLLRKMTALCEESAARLASLADDMALITLDLSDLQI